MRKLNRASVPAPPSLTTPSAAVAQEKLDAAAYYAARTPWQPHHVSFKFKSYRGADVKAALRALSGGKCAYCESKIYAVGANEVEHYRPKGPPDNVPGHPGYWWLAHDWFNLLPTCRDCNKSLRQHIVTPGMTLAEVLQLITKRGPSSVGKASQFEVQGVRAVSSVCCLVREDAKLIDPCCRDPKQDVQWDFSSELTLMHAKTTGNQVSSYGEYTIRTCGLNRATLVLDRIPCLRPMRFLKGRIVDRLNAFSGAAAELQAIRDEVSALATFAEPDQPYSGMAAAFIDELEWEVESWRVQHGLPVF